MSSILIKGAEKPDHCLLCFAFRDGICAVAKKEVVLSKGVQESCPLVEISPHGRLIDADALKTKLNNIHDFLLGDCEFSELAMSDKARIDELINCIAEVVNAPTVIESEE